MRCPNVWRVRSHSSCEWMECTGMKIFNFVNMYKTVRTFPDHFFLRRSIKYAVGELFLSAFLQVLFDRLASRDLLNLARREGLRKKLKKWEKLLTTIKDVLDDAEDRQYTDKAVKKWLDDLRDLAYDVEDILGEFDTEASRNKLMRENQASASKGKRFLVILDDVWTENYEKWITLVAPFQIGAPGSAIIITTRNEKVSSMVGTIKAYALSLLSNDDCLPIFTLHALGTRDFNAHPNLKDAGEEIVRKCKGLPLAAKTSRRPPAHYNTKFGMSGRSFEIARYGKVAFDVCKSRQLASSQVVGANSLEGMPPQIGKLVCLQTLLILVVGKGNYSRIIRSWGVCQIFEGALCISRLENVIESEDASDANLISKSNLDALLLDMEWQSWHYGGEKFPTWFRGASFPNMVLLRIENCPECTLLPPIGELSIAPIPLFAFDSTFPTFNRKCQEINPKLFSNLLMADYYFGLLLSLGLHKGSVGVR
ncbi:Disease resistance protein RGA2 [Morella rubra]|uniref:Disease resistance protein RGA2 n=1 Tax=Morella rubra TaxID=262757 RepID=A0A6A1UQY3_9ROSI|nr:Disease resistance protein RGA2 [Morella rubra]